MEDGEFILVPWEDEVILIFEMTGPAYRRLRERFDALIAENDLTCHVRMGDGR